MVGPADTQERWLLDALVTWRYAPAGTPWAIADIPRTARRGGGGRVGPIGPRWWPDRAGRPGMGLYLADQGFLGAAWHDHWVADASARMQTVPATVPSRCGGRSTTVARSSRR